MPTRFYYSAGRFLDHFPNVSHVWVDRGNSSDNMQTGQKLDNKKFADIYRWGASTFGSAHSDQNLPVPSVQGLAQFISDPIAAQTISGIIKGQLFAQELNTVTKSMMCRAIIIRVFNNDFTVERGILLEDIPTSLESEFAGTWMDTLYINRKCPPPMTLNPVACQDGDRIVVELGITCFAPNTPPNPGADIPQQDAFGVIATYNCGIDLPEDESQRGLLIQNLNEAPEGSLLSVFNPWIEFEQDIVFVGGPKLSLSVQNYSGLLERNYTAYGPMLNFYTAGEVFRAGDDYLSGKGVIRLDFLKDDPPYDSSLPYFPLNIAPSFETTLVTGTLAVNADVTGSGGITVGGAGVITFISATILSVIGEGGVIIGGRGVIKFYSPVPTALNVVGSGGIDIAGKGVIQFSGALVPAALPTLAVIGSGGVVIGGQGVVTPILPSTLAIVGSGGIKVGVFRVPELSVVSFGYPANMTLVAVTGSGGVAVGGTGVVAFTTPPSFAVPGPEAGAAASIQVGGKGIIAFIAPQIMEVIGAGGVLLGGEVVTQEETDTYSLMGARGEPSIYSGFLFNSYCEHRNKYFAAGPGGIYLLEGADDDGKVIHSGVKIGPNNYSTDRQKRLRLVRCGGSTSGAQVKVSDDQGRVGYYDMVNSVASGSQDIQGREITLEILDFKVLDHLEILPLILSAR